MKKSTFSKLLKFQLWLFLIMICMISANAQVKGRVFVDVNSNGLREVIEPFVPNAPIKVYRYSPEKYYSVAIAETKTDAEGNYSIFPSSYPVRIELAISPGKFPLNSGNFSILISEGNIYGKKDIVMEKDGIHDFNLKVPVGIDPPGQN